MSSLLSNCLWCTSKACTLAYSADEVNATARKFILLFYDKARSGALQSLATDTEFMECLRKLLGPACAALASANDYRNTQTALKKVMQYNTAMAQITQKVDALPVAFAQELLKTKT